MSELTIAALKARQADVTLYVIEADRHYYALLADKGLDENRLHDLFLASVEGLSWKDYFDSSWYPLAQGKTAAEANDALIAKIRSVSIVDIDKYNRVLYTHSYFIYDNFASKLEPTLEEAYDGCVKFTTWVQNNK